MWYFIVLVLGLAGGGAGVYFVMHLPLQAKIAQAQKVVADELAGASKATQSVLGKVGAKLA